MPYPTLEQYNEALQHPKTALIDPKLNKGMIRKTGLGLPLALCGGFALTYTIESDGNKYAVRCFHKQSNALEQRYRAISNRLNSLRSPRFVDFEFQPQGVRVSGKLYPIVKMAWASGDTLGEFLEKRKQNKTELEQLHSAFRSLATNLESQSIAHGDIAPGNILVSNAGKNIQLIDYDGMYVDAIASLGAAELGQRNFQHPGRTQSSWDKRLDRFSFIVMSLAIRALQAHPQLWNSTQSDETAILFRANDFADPSRSKILNELFKSPELKMDAANFAAICRSPFAHIPTLEDFLVRKNIPQATVTISVTPTPSGYMPSLAVLSAQDYVLCSRHVGDRVELIGQIADVKPDSTRGGKPYIFINFGDWRGNIVKINIWSEGLSAISQIPDQSWVGKWISVVGLMEPPYTSKRYHYSHLSISITQSNQMHIISEAEARFRLGETSTRSIEGQRSNENRDILEKIQGTKRVSGRSPSSGRPAISQNQGVLQAMKTGAPTGGRTSGRVSQHTPPTTGHQVQKKDYCFIASAVYGPDAPETNLLRCWRDTVLMASLSGRIFVRCYYKLSPRIVPLLMNRVWLTNGIRRIIDRLLAYIKDSGRYKR